MDKRADSADGAPELTVAAVLLLIWSFLFFLVRLWVKLRKNVGWGLDDTTFTIAFSAATAHVITVCAAVSNGYGRGWQDISLETRAVAEKMFYASQVLYAVSMGVTRVSIGTFVVKMARDHRKLQVVKLAIGVCVALVLANVFLISVRGEINQPWVVLDGSQILYLRWLVIEVSGLVVEFALWAIAVWFIWSLHMPVNKRCAISAILAVRLLLVPLVVLRLLHLLPPREPGPTDPAITAAIYMEVVLQSSLILSSATCARPFLRPFHSGYFTSTSSKTRTIGYMQPGPLVPDDSYQMITDRSDRAKRRLSDENSQVAIYPTKHVNPFRPDVISHQTESSVSDFPRPQHESGQMVIFRTDDWGVSFEQDSGRATKP